jgi:hypothetical protein
MKGDIIWSLGEANERYGEILEQILEHVGISVNKD